MKMQKLKYLALLSLLLSITVGFNTIAANPCGFEVTFDGSSGNVEQELSIALLEGVWTASLDNNRSLYIQFNRFGVAGIIEKNMGRIVKHSNALWETHYEEEQLMLLFTSVDEFNKTISTTTYEVKPVCEGLALKDTASGEVELWKYTAKAALAGIGENEKLLKGEWSCSIYANDNVGHISGVYFKYIFRQDGSFIKVFGANNLEETHDQGAWQLMLDGKHLLLHIPTGDNTFVTKIVKLGHITIDELVLERLITTCDMEEDICASEQNFYFNKI